MQSCAGHRTTIRVVLGLIAAFFLTACEKPPAPPAPGPPDVEVTEVIQQNVPIFREWVAQLNGPINAAITPKVQGYLLTQNYNNGFFVKKGQLLFTIDPRPFIASLDQEKAGVAQARGKPLPGAKKRRPGHTARRPECHPANDAGYRPLHSGRK